MTCHTPPAITSLTRPTDSNTPMIFQRVSDRDGTRQLASNTEPARSESTMQPITTTTAGPDNSATPAQLHPPPIKNPPSECEK